MKKSKFTEEQIAYARLEVEGGRPVPDVCRQIGRSHVLRLEEELRALRVTEWRRLRQLEDEDSRLKRLVADVTLDKHMLSER
jgi:putative transposase